MFGPIKDRRPGGEADVRLIKSWMSSSEGNMKTGSPAHYSIGPVFGRYEVKGRACTLILSSRTEKK